jgi:hypothetical protein
MTSSHPSRTSAPRTNSTPVEPLETRIAPAAALIGLGDLDGTNGFKLNGVAIEDGAGASVSSAGDVNRDGYVDLIVGAPGADPGGKSFAGETYVVFGKAGGIGASFDLATLDGTNGFKIVGESGFDYSGSSVSAAGDINGDGFADLIVGAKANDPQAVIGAGAAYIIYGKKTFVSTPTPGFSIELASSSNTKIAGGAAQDLVGFSVRAAGDVNRDGRADLIIGAPSTANFTGASYVVFGKTGGLGANFNLATLNGVNGFRIDGEAVDDHFGSSVAGAGDINGDGFADLIIGAYDASTNGNDYSGAAYVIFGKRSGFTATLALSSLNGTNGFKINGEAADDYAGWSVSGAGDVNGDGFGDLVIGASTATRNGHTQGGSAYVVFGKKTGFTASLNLSALDGLNGFEIPGHENSAKFGHSVSSAGDLNRDGFADLIIGAPTASPNGDSAAGSAYAIFGKRDGFTATLDLATLDGIDGFRIDGVEAGDQAGFSVAAAGDLNKDGYGDLIVGAFGANPANIDGAGTAYVIYGTALPMKIAANGRSATLTDVDGDVITVSLSKGFLSQDDFTLGLNDKGLLRLNLSDDGTEFAGANITVSAKKVVGGDGKVNVGAIDGSGIDLGAVTISGDLGQIDAGDGNLATTGLSVLSVGSLGAVAGTQPIGTVDPLHSEIDGKLGTLKVSGSVLGVVDVDGAIGPVSIGGSLDGSAGGTTAGLLRATGDIGTVTVKGSVIGGADLSGVVAGAKLGSVSISGSLLSADSARPVTILAKGKAAPTSVADAVAIAGLTVRGQVLNAQVLAGFDTNLVQTNADASIGNVTVGTGLTIGDWTSSLLQASSNIGNVSVSKSVIGGAEHSGISAGAKLGTVRIGQSLFSLDATEPVTIVAGGKAIVGSPAGYTAIGGLTVKGNVFNAAVLAGFDTALNATYSDASIGNVSVGTGLTIGDWTASLLQASLNIGTVSVSKSVIGGPDHSGISAGAKLGTVTIGQNLTSSDAAEPITLVAGGKALATNPAGYTAIAGLTVKGDVRNALVLAGFNTSLNPTYDKASIGNVTVGTGTTAGDWNASLLKASVNIGNVTVSKNFIGTADHSGIAAGAKLGRVTVGLDLRSDNAATPVMITAEGKTGATGNDAIAIAGLTVKGGVLNARILADSDVTHSQIDSNAAIGTVAITGDWVDSLLHSTGNIGNVSVGGDFVGTNSLGIIAGVRLGAVTIGGDLFSLSSATPVFITAVGKLGSTVASEQLAIASLTVKGNVQHAWILAGYGQTETVSGAMGPINGDASIGAVTIGTGVAGTGNWLSSNLVAGVEDKVSPNNDGFGSDDLLITAYNDPKLTARIASVVIRGTVSTDVPDVHFGITAQQIGSATVSGIKRTLTSAIDAPVDLGGNTSLVEVASLTV